MKDWISATLSAAGTDGRLHIEARLEAEASSVWAALTEPDRLAQWYGVVSGDLAVGGEYHATVHASGWDGTGRIEACEPGIRLVTASRDPEEDHEELLEVVLDGEGDRTLLVINQSLLPLDLLAAYSAGMQIHVEDLAAYLAGRGRVDAAARFGELIPRYKELPVRNLRSTGGV